MKKRKKPANRVRCKYCGKRIAKSKAVDQLHGTWSCGGDGCIPF